MLVIDETKQQILYKDEIYFDKIFKKVTKHVDYKNNNEIDINFKSNVYAEK